MAWRLEAAAYDLLAAAAFVLPLDLLSATGGWLARTLGPLTGSHRTAAANLRIAFPELDDAAHARLLREQWDSIGRATAEFPVVRRIVRDPRRLEVVGGERLAEIARSGEVVVFVSGHLSNWEVMPAAIVAAGVPCQITYRAANNPHVDARIRAGRARYGVRLFAPKGGEGARELLEAMGRGESVALMNDQKFNGGVLAPFFGVPAHTAPGPSRLALRFGAVLQPMSVQRLRGARYRVVAHPPIRLQRGGDRAADLRAGVEQVNAFIEARVRERPAEWFWVHKRWPAEVYQGGPARAQAE